jgi:hypothetical protein
MSKKLGLLMLVLPMSISVAYASDASSTNYGEVNVSGFGTLGYARLNTNDAEFIRPNQERGAGKTFKNGVDSNLGLQATSQLTEKISVTGQTLIRKDGTDDFGAELAWAFAKYKLNDNLSIRVGRMGLPAYMISDYRNVGYANTMIRPPSEVYSQVPLNHIDGVDATYTTNLGEFLVTGQLAVGRTKSEVSGYGNITANHEIALNLSAEYGPLTMRFGHVSADINMTEATALNGLLATLTATGFGSVANELSAIDKKGTFTSVGATLDHKNYLIQAEYAKRKIDAFVSDTSSWYVMGGYRMGDFLPYVSHGSLKQDSAHSSSAIPAVGPLLPLAYGVRTVMSQDEQTSNTIGIRWDFKKSAALKVQVDQIKPRNGQMIVANAKPGFNHSVTAVAAAVDFVF